MQRQGSSKLKRTTYLSPFKWQLWGAVVAAMLVLNLALWACYNIRQRCFKTEQHHSVSESLFMVFRSFCAQGNKKIYKNLFEFAHIHV
jgi:hypothetical protein